MNVGIFFRALLLICIAASVTSNGLKKPPTELETVILYRPEKCNRIVTDGDTIKIHYTGLDLSVKKQFDSSRDSKPVQFTVGKKSVYPAWDLGVKGMCVGEIRRLFSPAELAYAEKGYSVFIKPNESVVFDIQLVEIHNPIYYSSLLWAILAAVGIAFAFFSFVWSTDNSKNTKNAMNKNEEIPEQGLASVEEVEVSDEEEEGHAKTQ